MPDENARPAPRTTTTHTAESAAARSAASASAAVTGRSRALSTPGRFSVIVATPLFTSYRTGESAMGPRSAEIEDGPRDDHPLNLGGAFADLGELGVAEDALDGKLGDVARAAVDLERLR